MTANLDRVVVTRYGDFHQKDKPEPNAVEQINAELTGGNRLDGALCGSSKADISITPAHPAAAFPSNCGSVTSLTVSSATVHLK